MGRNSRKSEESRDETLRGKLREMHKELRRKDQEISQLRAEIDRLKGHTKSKEKEPVQPPEDLCPNCGRGHLNMVEIPRRGMAPLNFLSCDFCDYKVKKNDGR